MKLASNVCPTSVFGAWSLLRASFASCQICMTKLARKHRTSNICLLTSKNVFDPNQKHFCFPTCKMCFPNMKCLKNLMVAKQASKDRLLKLSHVRQTVLVSFVRPQRNLSAISYFIFLRYPIYNSVSGGYKNAYVRSALYDILIYLGKLYSHFSNSWTILSSLLYTNSPTKGRPTDLYRGKISSEAAGVVFSVWQERM